MNIVYCQPLEKIVPDLKKKIEKSPDKSILILSTDFKKMLGPEFSKNPSSVYFGIKGCLFKMGIYIEPNIQDNKNFILLRNKTLEDRLNYLG